MTSEPTAALQRGLVTIGETLALLIAPTIGRLANHHHLNLHIGGAESNVAIGVARLGGSATWIGRVGDDGFGELILSRIRGEGVAVELVVDHVPTSVMISERRTSSSSRITYYRRGGPGSRLTPDDLNVSTISQAGVLHLTGITPALSPSARDTVHAAIDIAAAHTVPVSFDINYRSALWESSEASRVLGDIVRRCDLVFASSDELHLLGVEEDLSAVGSQISALGPAEVIIKRGAKGASAWSKGKLFEVDAVRVTAVDPVGAGDAFAAGYLAEMLAGEPIANRLETAAYCGAFAVITPGDWENSPSRGELSLLKMPSGTVQR